MNKPKIITTTMTKPPTMLLYAPHGLGKSTFAANSTKPIFIDTEGGLEGLSVQSFGKLESYDSVVECLDYLLAEPHEFKTLVIDSLDWLDKLVNLRVCAELGISNMSDVAFKPYTIALMRWQETLRKIMDINTIKKMSVIMISHAQIKRFEDPIRESYDQYVPDLRDAIRSMICEYVDIVGFADFRIATQVEKGEFGTKTVKAKSTEERLLYVQRTAAFDAKNRFRLPSVLPLDWSVLIKEIVGKNRSGDLSEAAQVHAVTKKKVTEDKYAIAASIENTKMTISELVKE